LTGIKKLVFRRSSGGSGADVSPKLADPRSLGNDFQRRLLSKLTPIKRLQAAQRMHWLQRRNLEKLRYGWEIASSLRSFMPCGYRNDGLWPKNEAAGRSARVRY
jgi:hypothetical protein